MNICRSLIMVVCFSFCLAGQDAPLTRDTIIQMVKAGLPEDVIVSKIRSEPNPPQWSVDDLIALKSAGASDGVLRALVSPGPKADPPAAGSAVPAASADPDDPMAPHDPGVYIMITSREGGKKKMVLIDRAGSGRVKTAGIVQHAVTFGAVKGKAKTEIPGSRAPVRTREARPEFYMYFPPSGNLGATDTISSPSQFSLLQLEPKKDHRETTIFKVGFGTASAGNDEKKTRRFNAEKIRPYVYKVIPDASLQAGEYAFIAATGMSGSNAAADVVIFDFGVDVD
jgi:hypothetical protein